MSKQSTTHEFIEKSISIHGEKYSYENVAYKKAEIKVSITCVRHGDFLQTPNSHLNGNGCPKCGVEKMSKARTNKKIVNCIVCGKEIAKHKHWLERSDRHLCSPECWSKWARESGFFSGENSPTWKGGLPEVPCSECGKLIQRDRSKLKRNKNNFCSPECQKKYFLSNPIAKVDYPHRTGRGAHGGAVLVTCHTCGKEFYKEKNQVKNRVLSFCDRKCWAAWRRSGAWSKENSPTYKPEMPDSERYWRTHIVPGLNTWIKRVKERENSTCQVCGIQEKEMIAHHINSWNAFPEMRTDLDNGACLCERCHDAFHATHGRGNNTRAQFDEFLEMSKNGNPV